MECRRLEVMVKSATDLKYGKVIGKRGFYVVVSVSVPGHEERQFTPVQRDGGTSPCWDHTMTFTVDEDATHKGIQKLKFEVKAQKSIGSDKEAGSIEVPVKTLLGRRHGAGGDGDGDGDEKPLETGYGLTLPSGKIRGNLQFSYKFGKRFTVPPCSPPAIGYPLSEYESTAQPVARPQNGGGNFGLVGGMVVAGNVILDTVASIPDFMDL